MYRYVWYVNSRARKSRKRSRVGPFARLREAWSYAEDNRNPEEWEISITCVRRKELTIRQKLNYVKKLEE